MRAMSAYRRQRGATLIIGLIMLLLFTLMVSSSFMLSSTNLKAVGNLQARNEAIAAANKAIAYVQSTKFTDAPAADQVGLDLDKDGTAEYTAAVDAPECVAATLAASTAPSSVTLPTIASTSWNTVWLIRAAVNDPVTGAAVAVRAGVRVLLNQAEKDKSCP
ncbi:hypothetical protein [Pseudomonas sp. AN-1]|uniref:hypothetical protein n=1 Tax=Pseudomonas sp. AN-1 TaxID=3096605 RepID=UPI002A6AD34B|nr:hypothetical protein [Pseudomonas sp. AN-1]WPP45948.1 hypothetical protein SK095_00680 [Pseudomonas sp. AN-1]